MAYDIDRLAQILYELREMGEISPKPNRKNLRGRSQQVTFSKGTLLQYNDIEDYDYQNALCAHIQCVDPIYEGKDFTIVANNPFIGVAGGSAPNPTRQTIECCLEIEYGNEGEQFFCKANAPVGQSVKILFTGSFLKVGSYFEPRYWPRFDVTGAGGPFGFISKDDLTRNNIWNSPRDPDADLRANLPAALISSLQNNPVTVTSLVSRGSASVSQGAAFDFGERITRRFFGSVPTGAVGPATRVLCPIAKNAGTVQLICNQSAVVFNDIQPGPTLAIAFRLYNGEEIYNYNQLPAIGAKPNQRITIPDNAIAVLVYAQTANAVREIPFELVYDLGF
jgi:hypothetical protein